MQTDNFSYLLGVEVDNFDLARDDMYKLEIPTATYAVFTTPPVEEKDFVNSIHGTWKYILDKLLIQFSLQGVNEYFSM